MIDTSATLSLALECPACHSRLGLPSEMAIACGGCGQRWPRVGGVGLFGESSDYPQDFAPDRLAEMLSIAEAAGWQATLHDYMRPLHPQRYRHAVDEYRAQWRCLLPSQPQARVLDFRCGWGPVTVSLAEDYGLVVAADTHPVLARFTALRAEASGLANVQALSLDPAQRLPFSTGYFDLVVLQSALEWGDPAALLRELARVLAPGGCLFVNVPNQLDAARLLQAVPGRLRRRRSQGPAGGPAARQRTLNGYRRDLAEAGFDGGLAHAVLPSVAEPFYVVPLGSQGAMRFFLDNLFNDASLHLALAERHLLAPYQLARALWQGLRLLPFEPLLRHFVPGYALLARRG